MTILIISHDVIGGQMAGPGIRYYQMARTLSKSFYVILAAPRLVHSSRPDEDFRIVEYEPRSWDSIDAWVSKAQVVILNSELASEWPQIGQTGIPVIVDGYDPLWIEWLLLGQDQPDEQERWWTTRLAALARQFAVGDLFLCASERQRDWWLGLLEAHGRINPYTLRQDASLRELISVVPFGLSSEPPVHTRQIIKGVWKGIAENDRVILWGGGLWPWFDPLLAIRAMAVVAQKRKDVRLIFPGTRHPNPAVANIPTHVEAAKKLAHELGLADKYVFFRDWIPYLDWQNVLVESDIGLSLCDPDSVENRLAFRTRILDYLWSSLPTITTEGDTFSDVIARYGLGKVISDTDVGNVAQAILDLLSVPRETFSDAFNEVRQVYTWDKVLQPVMRFCRDPYRSPDKLAADGDLSRHFDRQQLIDLEKTVVQLRKRIDQQKEQIAAFKKRKSVRFLNYIRNTLRRFK